jgi:hypothetical protein
VRRCDNRAQRASPAMRTRVRESCNLCSRRHSVCAYRNCN